LVGHKSEGMGVSGGDSSKWTQDLNHRTKI